MKHLRIQSVVAAVASALLASIALAGCGGEGDKAAITKVVQSYDSAIASGDGFKACAQLTGSAARSFVSSVQQQDSSFGADTCAAAVQKVAGNLGGDEREQLRDTKVAAVSVVGTTATAKLAGTTGATQLTKTGGHWYISSGLGG